MPTLIPDFLTNAATAAPSALSMLVILLKATALLVAALAATVIMQRASAGSRHLVWLVVLGALLALPALAAWSPLPVRVLPREAIEVGTTPLQSGVSSDRALPGTSPANPATTSPRTVTPTATTPNWMQRLSLGKTLLAIWLVVAFLLVARLAYGAYSVRRIVRRAQPLDHPDWQTPLYQIADRLGLDAAPQLLRSEDVKMPFASGLVASTIVLPAESDEWSAERRSAVLIHELGHVRRRDLIGHTLGRVACALYWFHPLVWTAARRLRAESERACDDLALVFGAKPSDYAEHLLDIVTCVRDHYTPSVALAMAQRKEFEGRMLAILNPELTRKGPSRWQTASIAGGLAVLALLVGAAAPVPRQPVAAERGLATPQPVERPTVFGDTSRSIAAQPPAPKAQPKAAARVAPSTPSKIDTVAALAQAAALAQGEPDDERAALLAKTLKTDASAPVRRVAAWGLRRYARTDVGLEALVSALGADADAGVREMAAWSLAEARRSPTASAALVKAVRQTQDPQLRSTAVWSLGNIRDESALDALTAVLTDPDRSVREVAAWSIGSIRPDKAPAALVTALSDKERDVRQSVAWALYNIHDASTAAALEAAFRKETDTEVQRGMIRALGTMGDASIDVLQRLVTSPDPEIRTVAVTALAGGQAGGPWPWPRPQPRPFP